MTAPAGQLGARPTAAAPHGPLGPPFPRPAGYRVMLLAYIRLEVRRTLRDGGYVIVGVIVPVTMYLLFTNLGVGDSTYKNDVAQYDMIGMAAYGALGAALAVGPGVAEDRGRGWLRQLRITPLSPLQAVTGRAGELFGVLREFSEQGGQRAFALVHRDHHGDRVCSRELPGSVGAHRRTVTNAVAG